MGKQPVRISSQAMAVDKTSKEDSYESKRSLSGALKSTLIHILPVGVTFGILQLSFRNLYWADADAPNQRVKLSALQVAAKVHEILILVSLSSMVLHYTRKLMAAPKGISFGLLEAAYQSGLSSNPWTIGNWEALKHLKQRVKSKGKGSEARDGTRVRAWHLVILLVVFAFLALFIGPASAITLIPQLDWWHKQDLIGPLQNRGHYVAPPFSVYVPANLFPKDVDASHLPGSFCNNAAKDINNTCPSARIAEIQRSFTVPMPDAVPKVQNATISLNEDDDISRRMLYSQNNQRAAVTVPNYLLASFASLVRPSSTTKFGTFSNDKPFTLEIFANGAAPLDPLVGVDCNDTTNVIFQREYSYEVEALPNPNQARPVYGSDRKTDVFDIRAVWSEDELKKPINGTELVWKDVTDTTKTPVLLALLRHEQNVTVCTIQSYWTSTSQWILSTSNYDVATNFTFEDTKGLRASSVFGYPYALNVERVHIHEDWAETLNAVNGSGKVLNALLQFGIETIEDATSVKGSNSTVTSFKSGYQYFEATMSQLLAKTIANGLSRIGAQYAADHIVQGVSVNELAICNEKKRWCSQGPWFADNQMPLAVIANTSRGEPYRYFTRSYIGNMTSWLDNPDPILRSFAKPADVDANWTRLDFPVSRYGYAYAFQGITTYLSVAILCLHAAIVLAHVVYRVAFDCEIFEFGGSLGSLLTIAMGDNAPTGGKVWAKHVVLVPFGNAAETMKLKLEVVDPDCPDEDGDMVLPADPEEAMRLMQIEGRESRYPSAQRYSQ